jgi:hypothetical protein
VESDYVPSAPVFTTRTAGQNTRFRQDLHAIFLSMPINGMRSHRDDNKMMRLLTQMSDLFTEHEAVAAKQGDDSRRALSLRALLSLHLAIFRGWLREHGVSQIGDPGDSNRPEMVYYRICSWKSATVVEYVPAADYIIV